MLAIGHGISPVFHRSPLGYVVNLDTGSCVFTPKSAKVSGPGPFAAAPLIQGALDASGTGDGVSFPRGIQIDSWFYAQIDAYQGTIAFWITPEWDGNDGLSHLIFNVAGNGWRLIKTSGNVLSYFYNGSYVSVDASTWTAGVTYCVVCRWDANNTLDGTNHMCLSIDDSHTFGVPSLSPDQPHSADIWLLSNNASSPGSGILEGFTVYRRALYDGSCGSNVGNGDELNLIYNAGSGKDPTHITGSWDCVFCLPTKGSAGEFSTGTDEAWRHPHESVVLDDTFCQTTYGSSAWSDEGTPSSGPSDLAAAEKVFNWGYKWTCDAADEGITQTLSGLSAGQNYVLRVLAHCTSASAIRIRIWDETNGAQIGADYDFGASSSRTAPGVAIITFELPTVDRNGVGSDCTIISVKVMGVANTQEVFCHQVELQENLVDNPSLETGAGSPWIPDGWTNFGLDAGTPDDSEAEAGTVHSGNGSMELNTGATTSDGMIQDLGNNLDSFIAMGAFIYGDGGVGLGFGSVNGGNLVFQDGSGSYFLNNQGISAAWNHVKLVMRHAVSGSGYIHLYGQSGASGDRFADDLYAIMLTGVSVTVTPASAANSVEESGIRIDGRDMLVQSLAAGALGAKSGKVRFNWIPRMAAGDFEKISGDVNPVIVSIYKDASNEIFLAATSNTVTTLSIEVGGVTTTNTWDASSSIAAGTEYLVEIEYDDTDCTMSLDGVVKITVSPGAGIDFGANVPDTIYWGSSQSGAKQPSAVYVNP